jgi:predicted adenylyl cyclase CyaB
MSFKKKIMKCCNVEIKARINDLQNAFRIVENLADFSPTILEQVDTFFHCQNGRLKLREFNNSKAELISYLRPDSFGPKLSNYTRVEVENPTALKEVLDTTLGIKGVVKKRRTLFMVGQTRIHLDEVEGLGEFLEIEVVLNENQPILEGEKIAIEIMNNLGVSKPDLIDGSYIDLIEYNGR